MWWIAWLHGDQCVLPGVLPKAVWFKLGSGVWGRKQWRSQDLSGWASRPPGEPKWGRKWEKNWGKLRKFGRNLRKEWGNWNSCPLGTMRLATALEENEQKFEEKCYKNWSRFEEKWWKWNSCRHPPGTVRLATALKQWLGKLASWKLSRGLRGSKEWKKKKTDWTHFNANKNIKFPDFDISLCIHRLSALGISQWIIVPNGF